MHLRPLGFRYEVPAFCYWGRDHEALSSALESWTSAPILGFSSEGLGSSYDSQGLSFDVLGYSSEDSGFSSEAKTFNSWSEWAYQEKLTASACNSILSVWKCTHVVRHRYTYIYIYIYTHICVYISIQMFHDIFWIWAVGVRCLQVFPNSAKFGRNRTNSNKFGQIRPNSTKFEHIWPNSTKFGQIWPGQ